MLGTGPLTIGPYGCYLTSMTMVANHGGANIDVPTLNQVFIDNGRFVQGDLLTDQSLNGLFNATYIESLWYTNRPADLNVMKDTYEDEYIFEIWINGNPNTTHFVRWVSGHAKANLQIANPWDGRIEYFKDVYGDPVVNIVKIVHYTVPNPTVAHTPEPQAIPEPTVTEQVSAPEPVAPEVVPVIQNTEVVQPTGQPSGEIPVTVIQSLPEYQETYTESVCELVLREDSAAIDMSGEHAPHAFTTGTTLKLAGYFTEAGRKYWRGATSAEQGLWYGIPDDAFRQADPDESTFLRDEKEAAELAKEALHASAIYRLAAGAVQYFLKLLRGLRA